MKRLLREEYWVFESWLFGGGTKKEVVFEAVPNPPEGQAASRLAPLIGSPL